ncbi:MAG: hypothetical protein Q4E44_10335, partial [bacterium]|nr:hypothetical protein [bacterium]
HICHQRVYHQRVSPQHVCCLSPAVSQAAVSRQMAECQAKVSPITGRIRRYKALRTEIQASRD